MIRQIKNIMATKNYESMCGTVLHMNENVETYIYEEMMNHKADYDSDTSLRKTDYSTQNKEIQYACISVKGSQGHPIGLEYVTQQNLYTELEKQRVVLYIHGAAFQRRSQDLNIKTAERICEMTGYPVYIPDYRIGIDYSIEEMIGDIVDCYRYLIHTCGYQAENMTLIADSSGCTSMMAAIQKFDKNGLSGPKEVILMSPFTDAGLTNRSILRNKGKDIAFLSNQLLENSVRVFTRNGKRDVKRAELSPIAGEYECLKDTKVLIQVGENERLLDDSVTLYQKLERMCSCTLEVYEDMFHNFETYYSMCDMAKVSWENYLNFMSA